MRQENTRRRFGSWFRLDRTVDFAAILRSRKATRGKYVGVAYLPNRRPRARLGIVAAKRILPRAVDRNFCKRLAREVFRAEQARLSGWDVVVRFLSLPKRSDLTAAAGELRALLKGDVQAPAVAKNDASLSH